MTRRRWLLPAALGVLACTGAVSWLVVGHLTVTPSQRLVDLDVYRAAGRSVLDGTRVYHHVGHPPQLLPFTYPPFAALLAVPLAWMSFTAAGVLWTIGEVVTTAAICALAFRRLLERFGRWAPLAVGVLAGAVTQILPLRDEIKFGQVDLLLVLMCTVDCLFVVRRRHPLGGALVGLATAIKLTPGVFIVYLLVSGRRRAAAVAAGTFVAANLLAAGIRPQDSDDFWTDALWHGERLRSNAGTSNQSLRGMWLRAVSNHTAVTVVWLASAAIVAALGFARARAAQGRSAEPDAELTGVALTGLLAVLLSPVAWIHHLCWLILVLAVLIGDGRSPRRNVLAGVVYVFYVVKIPWIGAHLLADGVPAAIARVIEDGYGLMAVVLLLTLRSQTSAGAAEILAKPVTLRHTDAGSPGQNAGRPEVGGTR